MIYEVMVKYADCEDQVLFKFKCKDRALDFMEEECCWWLTQWAKCPQLSTTFVHEQEWSRVIQT